MQGGDIYQWMDQIQKIKRDIWMMMVEEKE
jgi:hypothetical protein